MTERSDSCNICTGSSLSKFESEFVRQMASRSPLSDLFHEWKSLSQYLMMRDGEQRELTGRRQRIFLDFAVITFSLVLDYYLLKKGDGKRPFVVSLSLGFGIIQTIIICE